MIVLEKENVIKDNAIVMMDFQVMIAAQKLVLEIALETENAEMEYVCVIKDFQENFAKKQK